MSQRRELTLDLVANVVIPTLALSFLGSEDRLGPMWALVLAISAPILHSLWSVARKGKMSPIAALALLSVSLTGGLGLTEADVGWFAWKEAAFPFILGTLAVMSTRTRWPAIPMLLEPLIDHDRLHALLANRNEEAGYTSDLRRATWWIGACFALTGVATFALARWMVVSPTGTEAFSTELGHYTAMSFPALGVPSTAAMVWVLRGVLIAIEERAGVDIDDLLKT